jgi:alkylation response protein AidB-like acyl-CoA dehydrogenase
MLLALMEISKACAATSSMIGAHFLGTDAILLGGNAEQHQTWLPKAASGEWLAGFALTEPRGGSHPADLRTCAVCEGDHYRIDGVKHFISNAAEAKFLVVFAKTDMAAGPRGVSAFIVDRATPGINVSRPEKLMGIRGAHAFEVSFEGVKVPLNCLLGAEGSGFKTAMKVLDNSRLDVAATSLGIAEAALAAAVQWARDRQIAGEALATKQGIQWMLADMKLRIEAAWGLTLQATALRTAGLPFTQQSAMAKLYASEMVAFVTDTALQIHGGYGYTREMPLERYARDARILRIYEGSSEIQRTIIARAVLA